jgi:hypothetical protein
VPSSTVGRQILCRRRSASGRRTAGTASRSRLQAVREVAPTDRPAPGWALGFEDGRWLGRGCGAAVVTEPADVRGEGRQHDERPS